MQIFSGVIVLLFGLYLWLRLLRRKTIAEVEGCTIEVHRGVETGWIVYREPSGGSITLDAHLEFRGRPRKISIEFPALLMREELSPISPWYGGSQSGILDGSVSRTAPSEVLANEVRDRISRGLAKLKIACEFAPPSGWKSFENGKQIDHGGPGVIRIDAQPK